MQAALLFLPAYAATLLFVWAVSLAEGALFGIAEGRGMSGYRRSFAAVFPFLFLAASGAIVLGADRFASRIAPGALLAPVVTALAPFAAGAAALAPAALVAAPLAILRKAGEA